MTADAQSPLVPAATEYTPESVRRCLNALATVVKGVGKWGPYTTVIGGLVPQFLISEPPQGIERHVGTTDVDLVVALHVSDSQEPEFYASVEHALDEAGFHPAPRTDGRGLSTWQWEREIAGVNVRIEFLCEDDGAGSVGRVGVREERGFGDRLGARRMRGAALATRDFVEVTFSAELLDNGGESTVTIRVANLLPLLVLKAFAIEGRNKDKDPYDIVWVLNAWPADGPISAARHARRSPVVSDEDVRDGIDALRRTFADEGREGPKRYARFLLGAQGQEDARASLSLNALGSVQRFLEEWDRE